MSALSTFFGFNLSVTNNEELPDLFPLSIKQSLFVEVDTLNLFMKILTDVVERTHGISDEIQPLLWDNCLQSESSDGLVTMLSRAISCKHELYLVYNSELKVLRKATAAEESQILADYKARGESSVGVYISFRNYLRADLIKLYSSMEYCVVSSLNKSMNLSKAIQIKISKLRESIGLADKASAQAQAGLIATGLSKGKDVVLDADDKIETSVPDLEAINASMAFLDNKRCFYLGLPNSYITGEAPKGLGDSGEGDAKAVERGLKNYYFAIIKPSVEAIFGIKTTFKSQDFRMMTSALEALKTFSLTDDTLVSAENKLEIMNKLLDLPEDSKGDAPPKVDPNSPVVPGTKKTAPPGSKY